MSYQALARKWRPKNFDTLVGQEHVVKALVNALDQERLHHALLFTGTRGVGKTTLGRIIAKALNCENGVGANPCGKCSSCVEIEEGRFVDLIEVDAASRTKVEDTRELLDNVQYAPTAGRFKVYLIDEVHMLSSHSFNALLKTLEEPPPHVKFLLATTDPQKLPVTILSRCLQFNLKRIPVERLVDHLDTILKAEQIDFEPEALYELARAADGSVRDSLSLLDQAIAFSGGKITSAEVRAMLGTIERGYVEQVLNRLNTGDADELFAVVREIDQMSPDYGMLMADLVSLLQRIALAQAAPNALDERMPETEFAKTCAESMDREVVQLYYQIALHGRRDLPLSPDPRSGFEMTLLRMLSFQPASQQATAVQENAPVKKPVAKPATAAPVPTKAAARAPVEKPVASAPAKAATNKVSKDTDDWLAIVEELSLGGIARELANNCVVSEKNGDAWLLTLEEARATLLNDNAVKRIQSALSEWLGKSIKVNVQVGKPVAESPARRQEREQHDRQSKAEESIVNDPNVLQLQELFGAEIVKETIQPADVTETDNQGDSHG